MAKTLAHTQGTETAYRLARELLLHGELAALAGRLPEAEAMVSSVWSIAAGRDDALADHAAWDAGWLKLNRRDYAGAAEWFGRVLALPAGAQALWHSIRQDLIDLCTLLAERAPTPTAQPPDPAAPAELPVLAVRNMGKYHVARGGRDLPICTARKATALFRYLLARPAREAHKEELMELLWPGAAPDSAAHSLHVIASTLRRHLDVPGASYLLFQSDRYFINPEAPVEDDSRTFLTHLDSAEQRWHAGDLDAAGQYYGSAIESYRGDYYVDNRGLAWAVAEQERLLMRYLQALQRQGHILMTQKRYEHAAERYQRLLERDAYREDIHGRIMLCYFQLGRRGEAIQQYWRCCAVLDADLGLEPMPETRELYRRIIDTVCEVELSITG